MTEQEFRARVQQHQEDIYAGQIDGERLNFDTTDYSEIEQDLLEQLVRSEEITEEEADRLALL